VAAASEGGLAASEMGLQQGGARAQDPVHRAPLRTRAVDALLDWGIALALLGLIVYFATQSDVFFTWDNATNIGAAVAVTGILAAGLTIALICGQLDLTVGVAMGMTTTIFATLTAQHGASTPVAILAAVGAGLVLGLVNGALVVNLNINSIIATIATAQVVLGVSLVVPDPRGQNVPLAGDALGDFANGTTLGLPTPFVVMIAVYAAGYVLLAHTRLGSRIYATGGNSSAALRAGIRTGAIYRFVFVVTALLAVLAGLIIAGRAGFGGAQVGTDANTFDALTAVLLGGIGLSGGVGRIERTLLGVLLVGVLQNGMTLTGVDSFIQTMVRGSVLVAAVALGAIALKRRARG
jgi:ribose/xylose/arabinose/galactoside ABC-type transport system permease subunit